MDAGTNTRICFLNVTPDEVIRSLFYNKSNNSIITVSVYRYAPTPGAVYSVAAKAHANTAWLVTFG